MSGRVEGAQCEILLDSGAAASVVRASLLKPGSRVRRVPETRLRAANNSFVKVLGKKRCWIEIAGSRACVDAYVAPELSSSCILGTDGLKALRVVLDFDQRNRATCGGVVIGSLSTQEVDFGEAKGADRRRLEELLKEYEDLFEKVVPGAAKEVSHKIVTTEHEPICCRTRRVPLRDQQIMEEYVQEMLKDGVISPSESPYRSPVVMVDKKDGKKRFCINYCKLNEVTIKNRYPLPRVDDLLDHTSGSKFFCVLDMSSAYWQVPLAPEDKWKTAFSTPSGHYHFNVMPFGLCNAPATQQEFMRRTFRGMQKVDVLLDDVIVHDASIPALLERLRAVFQRMREKNLKLKASKCHLMKSSVTYLGHVISGEGQQVDGKKVEAIVKYPAPKTVSELRTFLGMSTFLKKFVKGFAATAKPLYDLTKIGQPWRWTPECQEAFETLKQNLMSPPVLACPDVDLPYHLYTDASGTGMGATLCQEVDGRERVIAYASQNFNRHELRYATIEKEAAAVLWAIKFFHPYLSGARFKVLSDHAPLKWLAQRQDATGRLARWQMRLREHPGLEGVEYIKGEDNGLADGLSRCPEILLVRHEPVSREELHRLQEADGEFERLRDKMVINGGVWTHNGASFIPAVLRKRILTSYHGQGIHFGVTKTIEVMRPVVFWPAMMNDVRKFIGDCDVCKVGKSMPKKEAPLQVFEAPERPFQRIAMDFAGPFRPTAQGNKYFLVLVDHFSKYVKAVPARDCTMEAAIGGLTKLIFEEGVPEEVLTDQGSHFTGKKIQDFFRDNRIKHLRTTAYHPQCDGLAERQMRTIKDLIRCSLLEKVNVQSDEWDVVLLRVVARMNNTVHSATGRTPFSVARGRSAPVTELPWVSLPTVPKQEATPWVEVAGKIEEANSKNRETRGGVLREFAEGGIVWLRRPQVHGFEPRAEGPYTITSRKSRVNYQIRNSRGEEKVVHVDRLLGGSGASDIEILPSPRGRPRRGGV